MSSERLPSGVNDMHWDQYHIMSKTKVCPSRPPPQWAVSPADSSLIDAIPKITEPEKTRPRTWKSWQATPPQTNIPLKAGLFRPAVSPTCHQSETPGWSSQTTKEMSMACPKRKTHGFMLIIKGGKNCKKITCLDFGSDYISCLRHFNSGLVRAEAQARLCLWAVCACALDGTLCLN